MNLQRNKTEKIVWGCIYFLLICCAIFFIVKLIGTHNKHPTIVVTSNNAHHISDIIFPAFTFCSRFKEPTEIIKLLSSDENITEHQRKKLIEWKILSDFYTFKEQDKENISYQFSEELYEDFYRLINFVSIEGCWLNHFNFFFANSFTKYGLCFTFNLVHAKCYDRERNERDDVVGSKVK
ncbi:CLUMA_CG020711, isoform A [Clunio marinus]|uniref:CLUMA_CG020711, isoform A n=1 Tax=Clunio marinus TaxID=568069 RepID=A0A1J1J5T9_9DIPT|nr:CLUMA_CG020711, isoform A [Clunio marinus]